MRAKLPEVTEDEIRSANTIVLVDDAQPTWGEVVVSTPRHARDVAVPAQESLGIIIDDSTNESHIAEVKSRIRKILESS